MEWRTTVLLGILLLFCLYLEIDAGRRHRQRCPSYSDRVCCNMTTVNHTKCKKEYRPCDEVDPDYYDSRLDCLINTWSRRKRSYHDDDYHDDDHQGDDDTMCKRFRHVNATREECIPYCCNGWQADQWGYCTIPVDVPVGIVCENGGTPSDDGTYCNCQAHFHGIHCEEAICSPECQNFGACVSRDGQNYCLCPYGFTGQYCESAVCEKDCQNEGECYSDGFLQYCICEPGYTGEHCEEKVKSGDCPQPSIGTCVWGSCMYDSHCADTKKCCFNGCGNSCMEPYDASKCLYNGTQYNVGDTIMKGPCETCTCFGHMGPYSDGFSCAHMDCPHFFQSFTCPPGTVLKDVPGVCCAQCLPEELPAVTTPALPTRAPVTTTSPTKAPLTTPLSTRAPEFKNCPTKTTTVHVNEHNVVNLKVALKHIVATDHHGNVLSLTYSTMELRHCACSETFRNEHQIAVSTYPDDHGRIATCSMIVKVHDPHPPTFVTCPSKIQDFEDEVINWARPTVTDNVKVYMNELRSAYKNNTRFPDGNHMVTYIASDYEGNIAVCSFRVEIWKRDSKDPAMPTTLQRQKSSGEHEHNIKDKLHIILPVLGGIVLIAMAVILYMCCRRSRSDMRNTSQYAARGHTNATYGGYEGPPPDYDNIANQKLPPYTSSEPPVYEGIQKSKLPDDAGMDNPTYADPEEVKVSVQKLSNVTKA